MKLCKVSQVVFFLVCWAAGRPPCYVLRLANKRKLNESRSNLPVFENVEKTSYKRETATASLSISPSPNILYIDRPVPSRRMQSSWRHEGAGRPMLVTLSDRLLF